MGKRVKKKSRALQKEKRVVPNSSKTVSQQSNLSVETVVDRVASPKEIKSCSHLDKGFNLSNVSEKIRSSDPIRCEGCRQGMHDRRGSKGKGKPGKKKGNAAVDSKSETKAIWVCLECGHYGCGGVGLPTTSQSHAVRHARQTRHPLVIQLENPHLRWCFPCGRLIPVEKLEENGENKDVLLDVVKLIKTQSPEQSSADAEDVWFGGGSIKTDIKAEGIMSSSLEVKGGYLVRGLVNLGNTCFFNSVMQNLLAIDELRDYFCNQDASFGPLSIALKKLLMEIKSENGLKNVINPRSLFGCVCSKAPMFRGYQQQDSHELLRCLLDGLSTEELVAKKQINASAQGGIPLKHDPTFVEATFGGQISSTVCCVECGHSSTIYEPFLDLSLPLPTKKPPAKIVQPISRAKKTKLPPKRGGRIRPKANKSTDLVATEGISNPSSSSGSPHQTQSKVPVAEDVVTSSVDTKISDCTDPTTVADERGLVSENVSATPKYENEQVVDQAVGEQTAASFDDCAVSWMDYIGPGTMSDEQGFTSENNDISITQNAKDKDMDDGLMGSSQEFSIDGLPNLKPELSSVNPWEEEVPLQVQESEVLLLPYKEEGFSNRDITREEAEVSQSAVGCRQDEVDFDGLGDLFGEPDVSAGPIAGPSLGNEDAESGFMAGTVSESDPDEVDHSDSPVSVESCLLHFIKPELLSNDNAWECENCSKTLLCQRMEAKKRQVKTASGDLTNEGDTQVQGHPLSLGKDTACSNEVGNTNNGHTNTDTCLKSIGESLVPGRKVECSNQNCAKDESNQTLELNLFVSRSEEQKGEMNTALLKRSHSSNIYELCNRESSSSPAVDSCCPEVLNGNTTKDHMSDSQFSGNHEPEENENEEKSYKKLKVKRDATKRVLIDKAPPILTIHLKRFSQDARGRLSKLNGHVSFRDTIDLRPFMDPRRVNEDKYIYRLVGVVEHLGTMRGGHYVAYVRGGERSKGKTEKENGASVWYHASDAYVREVSLDEVLRSEAYILFYQKV